MKVNYYKADELWEFVENGKVLGKIRLTEVPFAAVLHFARDHGKTEYEVVESVPDEEKRELVEWFRQEIFPSKEFGKALIEEYRAKVKGEVSGEGPSLTLSDDEEGIPPEETGGMQ